MSSFSFCTVLVLSLCVSSVYLELYDNAAMFGLPVVVILSFFQRFVICFYVVRLSRVFAREKAI